MYREGKASEFDRPRKILGSQKFNVVSWRNAPKVGDEIVFWSRRISKQSGAKQSTMGFFDRDTLGSGLAPQLSHDRWFKVTY
jgi:hypothetical protein